MEEYVIERLKKLEEENEALKEHIKCNDEIIEITENELDKLFNLLKDNSEIDEEGKYEIKWYEFNQAINNSKEALCGELIEAVRNEAE